MNVIVQGVAYVEHGEVWSGDFLWVPNFGVSYGMSTTSAKQHGREGTSQTSALMPHLQLRLVKGGKYLGHGMRERYHFSNAIRCIGKNRTLHCGLDTRHRALEWGKGKIRETLL